ncbi:MAG: hypothetical protein J6K20_13500 [Thermoguttaceae bacterium]|nr:hypothetical protein [Thermoguttaceae bacterium]
MGTPMLVDSAWLDRANAALNALGFGTGAAGASTPAPPGTASRFYDVRPARIVGEWSRNNAGLWTAKANFVVGDAVDASFEFDVAAPLAFESETAPTAADATAFVVWRGRWELLSAPAGEGSRLGVGTVEALGADLNWYLVRSQLQDATNGVTNGDLVDVFDWIGSNTTNGTTLLVGQSVVFEWSPTWNRYLVVAAEPLI